MDLILVSITTISLVLAIAMGVIVFKLLREERQRSDARVALLRAAIEAEPSLALRPDTPTEPEPAHPAAAAGDLFIAADADAPRRRRLAVAVASAALVALSAYALASWMPDRARATAPPLAPLELVALQHAQDAAGLTITGAVLNPRDGRAVTRVLAAAFVYGPDGSLAGSGRAPLDYVTLGPGDETTFVVKVAVQGAVSRYRVGFRSADGQVVAHVDRRTPGSSARHAGRSSGGAPWVR